MKAREDRKKTAGTVTAIIVIILLIILGFLLWKFYLRKNTDKIKEIFQEKTTGGSPSWSAYKRTDFSAPINNGFKSFKAPANPSHSFVDNGLNIPQ